LNNNLIVLLIKGKKLISTKQKVWLSIAIAVLIVTTLLLWPKAASEAYIDTFEYQWTTNALIAPNDPNIQEYRYVNNTSVDSELYQYFVDKSIEANLDIIYSVQFANCLITAESGWNPKAENPMSTAYGLGQFLDKTWSNVNKALGGELDRKDPYDQIDAFVYLLSDEGYCHWTVAPNCIYLLPVSKRVSSLK